MASRASGRGGELLLVLEPARKVVILSHYNPDPDCIASSAGLAALIRHKLGKKAVIAQSGTLGRSENRAMVSALEIPMLPVEKMLPDLRGSVVLVDTQPGRANNALPPEVKPAAVIDHHPDWGGAGKVPFADLREGYGATTTIVTEYLQELEVPIDSRLATALFLGISTETQRFARETMSADIVASQFLYPYVDKRLLGTIQAPRLGQNYFDLMVDAIHSTVLCDDVALTILGTVPHPDAVAEVADLLVRLEGATWAVCIAPHEGFLYLSARTTDPTAQLGLLLASTLPSGTAGGHGMSGGGKIQVDAQDWVPRACSVATELLRRMGRRGRRSRWLSAMGPELGSGASAASRLLAELPLPGNGGLATAHGVTPRSPSGTE